MVYWYLCVQIAIIFLPTCQLKPLNDEINSENYNVKNINNETQVRPIISYKHKSYPSGVLFEQLNYVRISE